MSQTHREKVRMAFDAFLRACPALAAQLKSWCVQEEPGAFPDVLCKTQDGQDLGFELGEWINQGQISQNKKAERFQSDFIPAIGTQPENTTEHIHLVLLSPRDDRQRFNSSDSVKLREELLRLIQETDRQWPNEQHWQSPQGYHGREFVRFPTLGKYLSEVWFVPRKAGTIRNDPLGHGISWIRFKARGGSYSGESARKALRDIISKKASHYGSSSNLRVNLLIHYGADAYCYNTPFLDIRAPDFAGMAGFASQVVQACSQERDLPFEKVYLCHTLPPELEAYEILPEPSQVRSLIGSRAIARAAS